jgi:AI-2 transport protein TqsA
VNLISAALSFVILFFAGIDSPLFWAFLIFLLNFIPVIGMLIGTLFPAIFSLIQFGEFTPPLLLFFSIGTIQFAVGNVIEPRIMGNSLNISPLVAIVALAFWGTLWGITGMFLSVPITVIMIIVCSQFPKTRPVAILLSEKGKI